MQAPHIHEPPASTPSLPSDAGARCTSPGKGPTPLAYAPSHPERCPDGAAREPKEDGSITIERAPGRTETPRPCGGADEKVEVPPVAPSLPLLSSREAEASEHFMLSSCRNEMAYPSCFPLEGYSGAWSRSQGCWYAVRNESRYWLLPLRDHLSCSVDPAWYVGGPSPMRGLQRIQDSLDEQCRIAVDADDGMPLFVKYTSERIETPWPHWGSAVIVRFDPSVTAATTVQPAALTIRLGDSLPDNEARWVRRPCSGGRYNFVSVRPSVPVEGLRREWSSIIGFLSGVCKELGWGLECPR